MRGERGLCREVQKKEGAAGPTPVGAGLSQRPRSSGPNGSIGVITTPAIQHTLNGGDGSLALFSHATVLGYPALTTTEVDEKAILTDPTFIPATTVPSPARTHGSLEGDSMVALGSDPMDSLFYRQPASLNAMLPPTSLVHPSATVSSHNHGISLEHFAYKSMIQEYCSKYEEDAVGLRAMRASSCASQSSMDLDDIFSDTELNDVKSSRPIPLATSCSSGFILSSTTSFQRLRHGSSLGSGMFTSSSGSWAERLSEEDGHSSGLSSSSSKNKRMSCDTTC
jgi:hypothetical protein